MVTRGHCGCNKERAVCPARVQHGTRPVQLRVFYSWRTHNLAMVGTAGQVSGADKYGADTCKVLRSSRLDLFSIFDFFELSSIPFFS